MPLPLLSGQISLVEWLEIYKEPKDGRWGMAEIDEGD